MGYKTPYTRTFRNRHYHEPSRLCWLTPRGLSPVPARRKWAPTPTPVHPPLYHRCHAGTYILKRASGQRETPVFSTHNSQNLHQNFTNFFPELPAPLARPRSCGAVCALGRSASGCRTGSGVARKASDSGRSIEPPRARTYDPTSLSACDMGSVLLHRVAASLSRGGHFLAISTVEPGREFGFNSLQTHWIPPNDLIGWIRCLL
jgi:hypothetical protein